MPLSAITSHLVLDLLRVQLHPLDVVVAVEAAVNAVVLAVVGDVKGGEEVDRVAEVLLVSSRARWAIRSERAPPPAGEQGLEVLDGAGLVGQGGLHVPGGVSVRLVGVHLGHDLVHHVGLDALHAGQVGHVVRAAGGVGLQLVLAGSAWGSGIQSPQRTDFPCPAPPLSPGGSRSGGRRRRRPEPAPGPGRRDRPAAPPRWPSGTRRPSGADPPQWPGRCWP